MQVVLLIRLRMLFPITSHRSYPSILPQENIAYLCCHYDCFIFQENKQ